MSQQSQNTQGFQPFVQRPQQRHDAPLPPGQTNDWQATTGNGSNLNQGVTQGPTINTVDAQQQVPVPTLGQVQQVPVPTLG